MLRTVNSMWHYDHIPEQQKEQFHFITMSTKQFFFILHLHAVQLDLYPTDCTCKCMYAFAYISFIPAKFFELIKTSKAQFARKNIC